MNNFVYHTPTKIIFGKDVADKVGEEVRSHGGHKVMIPYSGTFLEESGMLDRVHGKLTEAGIGYVDLPGVVPNPRLSLVEEGMEICRREGVDFLLPIGGGSAMDTGKAIAYGLANPDLNLRDVIVNQVKVNKILPLGCICTIAATGSEMSNACVITIDQEKRSYINDIGKPLFAFLDPQLTYTLPVYQVACGAADIMMHTMERYFTNVTGTDLTDRIAEGLLVAVREAAKVAVKTPTDYEARATLMWAGSLSHNGLTGCGRRADWGCHKLQAELGGMFDGTHGAGLCALWGSWARYCLDTNPGRFAQFAVRVFGVPGDFDCIEGTALRGIAAWEDWCREIGMPTSLAELGVKPTDEQIAELARRCADSNGNGYVGNFRRLYEADCAEIYRMAR